MTRPFAGDCEVGKPEGGCGHADGLPSPHIAFHDRRAVGDLPVRDLNFDLKRLQADHDDGSHGTRAARSYALAQIADTLHELGFKGLRATGLRRKHVVALVKAAAAGAPTASGRKAISLQDRERLSRQG